MESFKMRLYGRGKFHAICYLIVSGSAATLNYQNSFKCRCIVATKCRFNCRLVGCRFLSTGKLWFLQGIFRKRQTQISLSLKVIVSVLKRKTTFFTTKSFLNSKKFVFQDKNLNKFVSSKLSSLFPQNFHHTKYRI